LTTAHKKVRVLVVDDSALVRKALFVGLSKDPEIEVIATAGDPYAARDILVRDRPDVITLDMEMPRMDGLTFLRRFMPLLPTPTIVVSSLTQKSTQLAVDCLNAGAVQVIPKPELGLAEGLGVMIPEICAAVKSAGRGQFRRVVPGAPLAPIRAEVAQTSHSELGKTTHKVIAIGASTGGVAALKRILPVFPPTSPGIVVVEHMPFGFTSSFAEHLAAVCQMDVVEAKHDALVRPGLIHVAPGGTRHLTVERIGGEYRTRLTEGQLVSRHCPSVDVLFESVAKSAKANATAVLMTGMGDDGAKGLLAIRQAGGRTAVQDAATCVIYGMPGSAVKLGAAEVELPLDGIPAWVLSTFAGQRSAHAAQHAAH
jgi:two-component system chemotaxis response regulator CheB